MQEQRGIIGSMPEALEFDHGSTSGNAIINQPMCWSNMRNPAENRLADFMLSPSHMNTSYVNPINQERHNLSSWSLGEPSSIGAQIEVNRDEQKTEHGWESSSSTYAEADPRLEERRYESRNILSFENVNVSTQSVQSSNPSEISPNLNLNADSAGHGFDNFQVMVGPNMFKSSGPRNDGIPSASVSESFLLPSGSGGYLVEENDGRPGSSVDGRRHSCKRKAIEGNIGQSSMSGRSSFFQRSESSVWPGVPTHFNNGSSLSISAPSEQANASLAMDVGGLAPEHIPDSAVAVHGESTQRNFLSRMNPSNQESAPPTLFSTGGVVRRSGAPSSHQSSRLLPVDHSMEFRSLSAVEGTTSQSHPFLIPVPALPQNRQPFRWDEGSSSRAGSSSTYINLGDGEGNGSRSMPRNLWQHPMVLPTTELRTLARNSAIGRASGESLSVPGNLASTSRIGSSSSVHPISAPTLVPPPNPTSRYSRRMAEYVRRSLFSASGAEPGGQNSISVHSGPPNSSEEMTHSSGPGNLGLNRPYPRSSLWMERRGDGVPGIPYPLRTLTAASGGRSRLVMSEIRNVLDLMRRGESLPFEDVMILDQSVHFGMADVHDRHRDMRLDVDNMSYEELLALEERIGNVSTGLSEETIVERLKQSKYLTAAGAEAEAEPCCICQEEYIDGEELGTLDCEHNFHFHCIKEWLKHKNLCPICKTTGLAT